MPLERRFVKGERGRSGSGSLEKNARGSWFELTGVF
jgi:hypothetical protein